MCSVNKSNLYLYLLLLGSLLCTSFSATWGFYGHRLINRMAVFTLPPELIPLYKKNIEFITGHAVDADKRRYATRHEAVRHYIDIDHWGKPPFSELPRSWTDALIKYTSIFVVGAASDTLQLFGNENLDLRSGEGLPAGSSLGDMKIDKEIYRSFFVRNILPQYYNDHWEVDCDSLKKLLDPLPFRLDCQTAFAAEHFTEYGILPYHLIHMQRRLTSAFVKKDLQKIIRLSTDLGHYLADAHVPLHTTENYNGQLTNQVGIHAFWESRIPELFAEKEWDFLVGPAQYIDDPSSFFWDIVLQSHSFVDTLLTLEKTLRLTFPGDQQFCYEERLGQTVRLECRAFAAAYNRALEGQVESRMQQAIYAIGSAWYTAWVDAGQPDLTKPATLPSDEKELKLIEEVESLYRKGKIFGRRH